MDFTKNFGFSFLEQMTVKKDFASKRLSSWDKSGKNLDFITLQAKEKVVIAEIKGSGSIKHIYTVNISFDPFFYRNVILRMYWDNESNPSVEVPIGDFFGIGHCKPKFFNSLLLSVNPGNPLDIDGFYTYGVNCYFPMPFAVSAKIELENQSSIPVEAFWFHIDYQMYDKIDENIFRFHAKWNREKITKVNNDIFEYKNKSLWGGVNLSGNDNYIILDAKGDGQLVGIILNVDNIVGDWWGEGDDMVFLDDEVWPPSIHGTGTEEIFGGGACPSHAYYTPYCGFHLISNTNWYRQNSMYRFFIVDPIRFRKSIKYTIEHGHANNFENDYSSVAYWYQMEPHEESKIASFQERTPTLHSKGEEEVIKKIQSIIKVLYLKMPSLLLNKNIIDIGLFLKKYSLFEKAYFEGKFDFSLNEINQLCSLIDSI